MTSRERFFAAWSTVTQFPSSPWNSVTNAYGLDRMWTPNRKGRPLQRKSNLPKSITYFEKGSVTTCT
jgi:hypothetical protein